MRGFTKLFASITESSIWGEDDKTLRVWICFLARCNNEGIVEGSIPGLAHLCRMSIDDFRAAVSKLESPDPYSRTTDHEGRRVEQIQGGWKVLNYLSYRDKGQAKEGSRAPYMRSRRQAQKQSATDGNTQPQPETSCNVLHSNVTCGTEERGEKKEAEAEKAVGAAAKPAPTSDEDFIASLEANEAYRGLDIRREFVRMKTWCGVNNKQPTRRRFINWLNRADKPMGASYAQFTPQKPKPVWLQIKELEARIESHVANHNRLGYDSSKSTPEAKEEWKRMKQTLKDLQAGQPQAEEGAIP